MDLDIKVEFLENGTQMPEADSTKVSLARLSYSVWLTWTQKSQA